MKLNFNGRKCIKASRILLVVYMALTFLSILMPDEFVIGILFIKMDVDPFQMIIRWFNYASFIVLPIAVFMDKPTFKKIAIYFCLPIAIINLSLFARMLPYFTSPLGTGIVDIRYLPTWIPKLMRNGAFRGILFFATGLTQIATIVFLFLRDSSVLKFTKEQALSFLIVLPCCLISILPPYALEGIFNTYTGLILKFGSFAHIAWIVLLIAEITILTLIFKKRPMEDRYALVVILSLSLLLQFNQLFSTLGELTCKRMPLQLCNLAAYLIFISVATKNRTMFLFNLLINVAGAVIAIAVLDVEGKGILYWSNIHYIVEHNNVVVVPLLCLFLGIFKPIEKKDFKNFVIGFSIYYFAVLILGTIFNSLKTSTGSDYFYCNYLYLFDKEVAQRLIPFAGSLFNVKIQIGAVSLFPVIQPIIYIAFFAIGTGVFFLLKHTVKEKSPATLDALATYINLSTATTSVLTEDSTSNVDLSDNQREK